ncbi:hypothetical protein SDC9_14907 [bioreactor metagenome]|uniref:Uncharacterized protein n=1 Tax=bioreactor metagenome TaxID=1076179 RepID=A0A644TQD4_9ZZZZ|nr:T9SS type A sorting domain-containing protein [Lentimicrobium sp.]MEA5108851.1 T9SS type A sorting domain-containing protein [Lentimicrobium sp.]
MRKLITHLIMALPLLALFFNVSTADAQRMYGTRALQDFETTVRNVIPAVTGGTAFRSFTFEIYLLDTDPEQDLVLAGYQAGIYINPAIFPAGATVSAAIVSGSSTLSNPSQIPNAIEYDAAINTIKLAGRTPPGPGTPIGEFEYIPDGSIISKTGFGTRIIRIRVTSSIVFTPNSFANLMFNSSEVLVPNYATRVAHYDYNNAQAVYDEDNDQWTWLTPPLNVQLAVIPGAPAEPGTNAHVYENPILNPQAECEDPAVFNVTGGGSYCEGGDGVAVGLDGSQLGVNYAIVPGTQVIAGTGSAITFDNQLAGTYAITATSDGTNPLICTDPVNMTGEAVVIATPLQVSTVSIVADPSGPVCAGTTVNFTATPVNGGDEPVFEWFVNGATQGVSFTGSFSYTPVDGDAVYVVLTPDNLCSAGNATSNTINMVVTSTSTLEFTESACDTYTWPISGETYTASGNYTFVDGCVTYILHLTITPSSTEEETVLACNSYTWAVNGETYTESGTYNYVDGCVTYVLYLTITTGTTVEVTETACDSFLWAVNGETYTVSGDYTYIDGCITYILHLTIIPSSSEEFTAAACDEYTWEINGMTYTASGDYTYVVGCVTNILHLTITPSTTNEITISACDSFTWLDGETYTVSGVYTYVDPELPCHTNILNLTITPSSTEEFTAAACDEYTWELNGMTYIVSGDYTYVANCVTNILHLTITPSSTVEFTETAVGSYTWAINGVTYTVSGTYTYVDGCVTYILYLTITGIPCPDISTWNGSASEDWFDAANWTPELLPCGNTSVTIPGGVPNFPTLTGPAACASIMILDGGSFIGAEYLTVAVAEVQRYFANSDFHFLSSPVTNINFGTVFPLNQDAVWAREYDEPSGDWVNLFVYDFMEVGKGYSIEMTEPQMALFPGVFNSNDVTKTLSYQNMGGDPDRAGWNLLGNPFQSAISWNAMVGIMPAAVVEAAVYVWDGAQYVSWNGFVGELTDGIIPAQNGFFVKAMVDQEIFNIPLSARVHSNIPFYKSNLANLLKLRANGNSFSDAAFIRFNEAATPLFDGQHDAYKLWGLSNAPQLYSIVPGDVLSINELPFEGNEVVNLGFRCGVGGTYSITASGMESFSASTPVMLEDLKLNTIQDLRQNPVYNFTYNTSDNENRFRLHFKAATGINDPSLGGISVYSYNHTVVITNTTGLAGDVRIYDLAGRELINTNIGSQMTTRIPMQAVIGTYIVKVITEKGTVNHKVFIR